MGIREECEWRKVGTYFENGEASIVVRKYCRYVYVPDPFTPPEEVIGWIEQEDGGGGSGSSAPTTPELSRLPNLDVSELGNYPAFKNLVTNLPSFLKTHPNVVKALSLTTGFTEKKILDLMQLGKGPKVIVVNNLTDSYGNKVLGQYDDVNKILKIESAYVKGLDVVTSPTRYQAIGLILTVTTLHEFVHYGRDISGLDIRYNSESGNTYEAGWFFEDSITPSGTTRLQPENAEEWLKYYKIKPKL